ncbi:FMN-binding glutamate synthase family protein [Rothia sp. ND6WE1A]|uniref:FMN-binding glutamate synthase family protein n=1 Tax=Rothia sp. ND6WE1A TaxID=1848190 RepID=UPI000831A2C8|nr:glutamate synthase family protein [Mycobacteroides abscessus subsp. abscessus]
MSDKTSKILKAASATAGIGLTGLATYDAFQKKHSIRRNFPVIGWARFGFEFIRPELRQYFFESNRDGRPFNRDTRTMIYEYAKGLSGEKAFGTEQDISEVGYDIVRHTMAPVPMMAEEPFQRLGGPDCTQPYDISLFNISSMSFGALSANAVMAMNKGAAMGGFAQETGEGGLTKYHLKHGADLIWEFGSGYFGCRDDDGKFDPELFAKKAATPEVKGIMVKISQGAKPGLGGHLPGEKVTEEIAEARHVPVGQDCISPAAHSAFTTPVELMQFVGQLRELSNGKPIGIKFCVGSEIEVLSLCKAMIETGICPDWITVDGAEGGTGAAPLEFEDSVGVPLTNGLIIVQNALVGAGLRDRVSIGAGGKITGGADVVRRIALGADFTNSARGMMMATGCVQAQKCHTNECPSGVATQNAWLQRGIDIDDKGARVRNYHVGVMNSAMRILASMGLDSFKDLGPEHVFHRVDSTHSLSYAKLYDWFEPGAFLTGDVPEEWQERWERADAHSFTPEHAKHQRA